MQNFSISNLKVGLAGLALAATVLSADALTLGRIRGAAWIGQPLDLTVSIELDAGTTSTAICQEVEVFYADSRQDNARVRTTLEPTAQANVVNLRVISSPLIDEPVVTVYLRAGCGQKTARRYVLLADYANESATAPSRSVTPVAPQVPTINLVEQPAAPTPVSPTAATSATATGSANPSSSGTVVISAPAQSQAPSQVQSQVQSQASAPAAAPNQFAAAPAQPMAVTVPAPAPATTQAPASLPPAQPTLKPPVPVSAPPVAAPSKPALNVAAEEPAKPAAKAAPKPEPKVTPKPEMKAAAQPPKKAEVAPKPVVKPEPSAKASAKLDTSKPRLKLDPVDTSDKSKEKPALPAVELPSTDAAAAEQMAEAKRMEDLQASVKALLDQSAKNEATLLALRERLEKAETERVPMTLVYALAALLIIAMAAVVYLWNRRMNEQALAAEADAEGDINDPVVQLDGGTSATRG